MTIWEFLPTRPFYNFVLVYILYIMYTMYMKPIQIAKSLDLTPFQEAVNVEVERWPIGGYRVKAKIFINYRWDTECEWLESNRIFGHKGDPTPQELQKEFATAIADIQEKLLFVFKANHGLLDREGMSTIRFKK